MVNYHFFSIYSESVKLVYHIVFSLLSLYIDYRTYVYIIQSKTRMVIITLSAIRKLQISNIYFRISYYSKKYSLFHGLSSSAFYDHNIFEYLILHAQNV